MCAQEGILWYNILNNPIKWKNVYIDYLLYMLVDNDWDNYKHLLFVQWGIEELNSNKINYNIIKQNITLIYKDLK